MVTRRVFLTGAGTLVTALALAACADGAGGTAPGGSDSTDGPGTDAQHLGEQLHSVWYGCGGGEEGDSDYVELSREEDGTVVAVRERKASWYGDEERSSVTLDESAFDELARIAEEYDLRAASEQPDSEIIALDAPTTSVTYAYLGEDGEMDVDNMFTVSDTQELDERQWEGFHAACEALTSLVP